VIPPFLPSVLSLDHQLRLHAFAWLAEQTALHGDVLPREILARGFTFEGERVPLLGPQGIFKPRLAELPLSITTAPNGPYDDAFSDANLLSYRFRGTDPRHHENVGLVRAMEERVPLVYFNGLVPGRYMAIWPVFIRRADPRALTFTGEVDDVEALSGAFDPAGVEARRGYITTAVRRRIHQRSFREIVLRAYRRQCSLCRLKHGELLDAAHIIEDSRPEGRSSVSNGISFCKLHHAAFDANIVGITPEYRVEIRSDILEEVDGPMLQHGLKEMNTSKLMLPHRREAWPNREALEYRYERFRMAG